MVHEPRVLLRTVLCAVVFALTVLVAMAVSALLAINGYAPRFLDDYMFFWVQAAFLERGIGPTDLEHPRQYFSGNQVVPFSIAYWLGVAGAFGHCLRRKPVWWWVVLAVPAGVVATVILNAALLLFGYAPQYDGP